MPLALDHVFCFCAPPAEREVELAAKAGFAVTKGTRHEGQGTANRSILFRENYFELIFVDDEAAARANPLRLDRRGGWRETGASPFGVCLRGELSPEERKLFWEYRPPYWTEGAILIHEAPPEHPLVFAIPNSLPPGSRASVPPELLRHRSGASGIVGVELSGPGYAWPGFSAPRGVRLHGGRTPQLRLRLDAGPDLSFNPLIHLEGS